MPHVLEIKGLSQEYPGVKALSNVSLTLDKGSVLGLVGENGAGKSTLIRALGGIEQPVRGEIIIDGTSTKFKGAADSQAAGISVVSQEFRLVSELSIADNVFLGNELTRNGLINSKAAEEKTRSVLELLGLALDPTQYVGALTVGDRQMVEIARALTREFDVLIMDEPTAALNASEIARLHAIVGKLRDQGKAIIYVSHHLDEIFELCDDIAVLRDGHLVAHEPTRNFTHDTLVHQMLGRAPQALTPVTHSNADAQDSGTAAITVKDLQLAGFTAPFSLHIKPGEIVGLSGLVGSGRSEFAKALFGEHPVVSGTISVNGKTAKVRSARSAIAHGIFMLSDDRKGQGILPHLDVTENAMLSRPRSHSTGAEKLVPQRKKEATLFEDLRNKMRIRVPHGKELIGNLSGGNQQKVLLGRALLSQCKVLILNEPTRGVDIGAKADIYELIRELAQQGVAVLVSSSDAPEIAAISDRAVVYFAGTAFAELHGDMLTEDNIVAASVGSAGSEN